MESGDSSSSPNFLGSLDPEGREDTEKQAMRDDLHWTQAFRGSPVSQEKKKGEARVEASVLSLSSKITAEPSVWFLS